MPVDHNIRARQLRKVLTLIPTSGNRAFGAERSPTHTHRGVDITLPKGTELRSPVDGVVTHASDVLAPGFSGYGRHVVVRQGDDGPWLLFAHLDEVHADVGEEILFGDVLGTAGDSCFSRDDPSNVCDGPHLHFEVSPRTYPQDSEAQRLNPVAWLQSEIETPPLEPVFPGKRPGPQRKTRRQSLVGIGVIISFAAIGFSLLMGRRNR